MSGVARRFGPAGPALFPLGLGCMNLSIEGRPSEAEAIRVICAGLDSGLQLLDTADVYGLDENDLGHNERLVARALSEWGGARESLVVATKGGVKREGDRWWHDGRPEHLKAACEASLRRLGTDCIDLYCLHAVDDEVPIEDSVGALEDLRRQGKILRPGLSNVSRQELERALTLAPIACVQNQAGPYAPEGLDDGVLRLCEEQGLAFVAHSPLGGWQAGRIAHEPLLQRLSKPLDLSPQQLVLAWLLAKSPNLFVIPGASRLVNVLSSAAVAGIELDDALRQELDREFLAAQPQRDS